MADTEFNAMSCPRCGGKLVADGGRELKCSSCGSKFALFAEITDDVKTPAEPETKGAAEAQAEEQNLGGALCEKINLEHEGELRKQMIDKKIGTVMGLGFAGYAKNAARGDAEAQYNLGFCYENAFGTTKDVAAAFSWYEKSAAQGFDKAQNNLGYMYECGTGTKKDYALAAKYYYLASAQGYARAQANLGYLYYHGLGVNKNYEKAAELFRLSAEQNNPSAQYNLGICYREGRGVEKDAAQAAEWFKAAAEQDHPSAAAQCALGAMYYNGEGVDNNYFVAVKWFRAAAEAGDNDAVYNLGVCYAVGNGVMQNDAEAEKNFLKAAENGHTAAARRLNGGSVGRGDLKAETKISYTGEIVSDEQLAALVAPAILPNEEENDEPDAAPVYGGGIAKTQAPAPQYAAAQAQQSPAMTAPAAVDSKAEKSKGGNGYLPAIIAVGVSLALFILGLVLDLAGTGGVAVFGMVILIISGFAECIAGGVIYLVYRHKEKYTCPVCGSKREQHHVYLRTTEKDSTSNDFYRTDYTHYYRYSYVCPNCGETLEEESKQSGGHYLVSRKNGQISDKRCPPRADI